MDILQLWVLIMFSIFFLLPSEGTFFSSSDNDNFVDRQEYSNSVRYQLKLPLRKAQTPTSTKEFGESQIWKPLSKSSQWTPQPHTHLKSDSWKNHHVRKKFHPQLQSQDDNAMTPVKPDRQYISETEDWHNSQDIQNSTANSSSQKARITAGDLQVK